MCGICGVLSLEGPLELPPEAPARMIGIIRHRGPDEFGAWRNESIFLGHARLGIIDRHGGQQPMKSWAGECHVTCNGEIFNYLELAAELEKRGHVFRTRSDTEVILNAYLEWGVQCLDRFNGQFAFALWDDRNRALFLARDRFGICPLFLAVRGKRLLFGSEVKALKAFPRADIELSSSAMADVLAYWASPIPGTPFGDVTQLPPGCYALAVPGSDTTSVGRSAFAPGFNVHRYWSPSFLPADEDRRFVSARERAAFVGGLRERLERAVTLRLRADVPVGAYLSGGVDSSAVVALAKRYGTGALRTFGLTFGQSALDEKSWQTQMARHVGVEHTVVPVADEALVGQFRDVPWYAETPLLRTSAGPLKSLSHAVQGSGLRVVLTGEGADEVFLGYNLFRETKVRRFWSRLPESPIRSRLFGRLYPYQRHPPLAMASAFFGQGLGNLDDPLYSHRPRWTNSSAVDFMATDICPNADAASREQRLLASLPREFSGWGAIARAQFLEMTLFMSGYLLSSQGDRMLMANSVEGRFPYLDHELVDYAGTIPTSVKLPALHEKPMLKSCVRDLVPDAIIARPKHPFRGPGTSCFATPAGEAAVEEFLLSDGSGWDFWRRSKVELLVAKWRTRRPLSPRDEQSFFAVLSGRMLQFEFGADFENRAAALCLSPDEIAWST